MQEHQTADPERRSHLLSRRVFQFMALLRVKGPFSGGGERPLCQMITCSAGTALYGAQRITALYCHCLGSPVNQHRRMRS